MLPKPGGYPRQCYPGDFDLSFWYIYDPESQITVIGKDMEKERPPEAPKLEGSKNGLNGHEDQSFFGSQLSSARNAVNGWVKSLRDGVTNGLDRTLGVVDKVHRGPSSSKQLPPQGQPVRPMPHGQFVPP